MLGRRTVGHETVACAIALAMLLFNFEKVSKGRGYGLGRAHSQGASRHHTTVGVRLLFRAGVGAFFVHIQSGTWT